MKRMLLLVVLLVLAHIAYADDKVSSVLTLDWATKVQQQIDQLNVTLQSGYRIPTGTIVAFYGKEIPVGWMLCDGSTIPSSFADLRKLIGDKVPDLRDMFLRGKSAERLIGSYQPDQLTQHTHALEQAVIYQGYSRDTFSFGIIDHNIRQGSTKSGGVAEAISGNETRPKNIAVNFIIKM